VGDLRASKLRLFGVALLGAKFALIPLIFDASLDAPFSVPKALISHGLAYLLAAVMVGLFVQYGSVFAIRSWLHIPVLAFLGASAAATVVAANSDLALYGTHNRMLGFASILDGVTLYFAIVLIVRRRTEAFAIGISAVAASLLVLGYEAIQLLGRDPFRWSVDSVARPFSTLGHPTVLAQYLTVLALGGVASALLVDRLHLIVRSLLFSCAVLLLTGAAATGTRSVLLGLGAGSAILVLLTWRLHPSPRARGLSLLGAAAAAVVVAVVLLFSPLGARVAATIETPTVSDDEEVLSRLEPSAAGRLALYEIGLNEVQERPILGYGPDNFIVGVPIYRPERAPDVVRRNVASSAHSWVIQVATSSGLLGLVCFVGIALTALALAFQGGFRPIALVGVATLATFLGTGATTVSEMGTEWLFWASVGAIAAATAQVRGTSEDEEHPTHSTRRTKARTDSPVKRIGVGLLLGGAILVALSAASALEASRSARASQEARLNGQRSLAVALGLRATRSDSRRAEYWDTLGLAYASTMSWREAVGAFDRARTLAVYDARYLGDLVTAQLILATAGDFAARDAARQLSDRGVQIDRNNPRTHMTRAVAMQVIGDLPEALISIERALALDPASVDNRLYVTAAQVMISSGRISDAIDVARLGIATIGPKNESVAIRIELARALVANGRPLEALNELDFALEIQPNNAAAQRLRGEIRAALPN
jgi:O-antigen ligase